MVPAEAGRRSLFAAQSKASHFLDGLLVVELGSRTAASACGSLLADLGAEIVRIEMGIAPDRARVAEGKRSLKIAASVSADDTAAALLEIADIVLISSDIDAEGRTVWEGSRPTQQIVCDFTAYGHTGPMAGRPHSEAMVQAAAGIAATTGRRDGPPVFTGAPFLDMETAVYGLAAILAALHLRRSTGAGQKIDMALFDVGLNALLTFIPLVWTEREATRNGNRHPTLAPWNAFRCRDGWALICGPTDDQWRRLCTAMQRPDLTTRAEFRSPTARFENVELVDAEIGAWTSGLSVAECVERVGAQGIPCSPIVPMAELGSEPNLVHRGMVLSAADPISGKPVRIPGAPIRTSVARTAMPKIPLPDADRDWCRQRVAHEASRWSIENGSDTTRRPLEGLRVIEVGMNTVAPLACRQLGALGADVIKVEPPAGDSNRVNAPLREDGESYIFALSNTDKRGIVLDLKQASDREKLWALLATADVMMENLKPGSLDKLGFGAEEVRRRFPRLIYCSVNGFGYDSTYPGRPALDTVIQGMSGAMSVTPVEGVPTKAGISISDQLGGQFGLAGILAALEARARIGSGAHLDIAMQDCSAWATQTRWNDVLMPPPPLPNLVETADGLVAVEAGEAIWRSTLGPVEPGALSRADAVAAFEKAGLQAAPVNSVAEVLAHQQCTARGLLVDVRTADGSSWRVLGSPLKLLSNPAVVGSAMPALGFPDPALNEEFGWPEAKHDQPRLRASAHA
jgi:crotonobetainyl-CoA:carnitine CoA-transferase CaiB-like acyl-CoA transferase